jgi:biotin synthase
MALQDIGISSLPVNILNPVAGTPLAEEGLPDITTEEVIKTIAVYRLLHPESRVRLTGGREVNLDTDGQVAALEAGADGILTGDYLTTEGQSAADDLEIMQEAGLEPNTEANQFDPEAVKERAADETDPETAAGTAQTNSELKSDD